MRMLLVLAAVFTPLQLSARATASDQVDGLGQLRGSWKVTAKSDPEFEPTGLVFKGDSLTIVFDDPEDNEKASIEIDAEAKPAEIDITSHRNGKVSLGIYEIDGETLQMCFSKTEKRPETFEKASGVILVELKRE
jgi:uncharacterized protein (TIGR03067 family)